MKSWEERPSTETHGRGSGRVAHYRPEIDGLRALSVGVVLLFHYGFRTFSGGFVGVDVFFVISGYLITGMLVEQSQQGGISLLDFYDRRIRRIFPAMFILLALCLVAGYFFQLPGEYSELGRSAAYSAASLANFYFLQNTGYFAVQAELQPLLHLWSLSVEEQFYLLWPVVLALILLVTRGSKAGIITLIAVVIAASFAVSAYLAATSPKDAFFLPQSRAWELALGAIIAFLPTLRVSAWLGALIKAAGLCLIAYAVARLSPQSPFPGPNAIFPCVGAALIVWPQCRQTQVDRILSVAPLRFVGRISYSLYLWHWPVLVFYRLYINEGIPTGVEIAALAAVAFAAAYLSWRFVEQPFRRRRFPPKETIAYGVSIAVVLLLVGAGLHAARGLTFRISPHIAALRSLDAMWEWQCPHPSLEVKALADTVCVLGVPWDKARIRGFLWGDSHAQHLAPLLDVVARRVGASIMLYEECPAVFDGNDIHRVDYDKHDEDHCRSTRAAAITYLRSDPSINVVILTASWRNLANALYAKDPNNLSEELGYSLIEQGLVDLIPQISSRGRTIALVGAVPDWAQVGAADNDWRPVDPVSCEIAASRSVLRRRCDAILTRADNDVMMKDIDDRLRTVAARFASVILLLPDQEMCRESVCVSRIDGEFLYRDTGHIRRNLEERTRIDFADLLRLETIFQRVNQARLTSEQP